MIPFSHSVATFRKSAWQAVGGYKEVSNEDLYLWFEMVLNGFQLGATKEVIGIHYKHPNSYWAKRTSTTSLWGGFAGNTPVAYNDGKTDYGYNVEIKENIEYIGKLRKQINIRDLDDIEF